jgi:hypothetical protein
MSNPSSYEYAAFDELRPPSYPDEFTRRIMTKFPSPKPGFRNTAGD